MQHAPLPLRCGTLDAATLSAALRLAIPLLLLLCSIAVYRDPMDPLSVTASIVAILQLTTEVIKYLNDVKDAPKDRARFAIEASNLSNLLVSLRYRLEEGRSNEAWYKEVDSLGAQDGPLDQYKHALEKLQLKVLGGNGLAKIGNALVWKFGKEEVASILSRIERLKSLVQIALQMDHLYVAALDEGSDTATHIS